MRCCRHKRLAAALAAALSLALAGQASAASHHPKGEYAAFAQCPLSVKSVTDCIYSLSDGGSFTVGTKTLPLINPLKLQGGFAGAGDEIKFYGAENGDTLSKSAQPLAGFLKVSPPSSWPKFLVQWFNEGVEEDHIGVIATIELVGPSEGLTEIKLSTENLLGARGTALGLPVRITLSNDLLGSNCHIGSASEPLELNFTAGHSGSLKGDLGEFSFNKSSTISTLAGAKLVDGTYAAPAASGCGGLLSYFLDPLIDSILGLPSPAGKNTANLEGKLKDAVAVEVSASE
jgi:hypothetical protein